MWLLESWLTGLCITIPDDFGSDEEDNDFGEEEDEDGGSDYEEKKGKKGKKAKVEKPGKRGPKRKRAAGKDSSPSFYTHAHTWLYLSSLNEMKIKLQVCFLCRTFEYTCILIKHFQRFQKLRSS